MVTVEYSKKQKCLHCDDLKRTLSINYKKFIEDEENDWIIIGIFRDMGEAEDFCEIYANPIAKERYNGNK